MPELPEVETTVRDLNKKILGLKIKDVWTDFKKMVKKPALLAGGLSDFDSFKKEIIGQRIEKIKRRGKNILFYLSGGKIMLIHQKLTGHLLVGKWKLENGKWKPLIKGALEEKINTFIHLMFFLSNNKMLALSDLRKFAKVLVIDAKNLDSLKDIKNLGPEPLDKNFDFEKFKERLKNRRGKIKQVLMDQEVIAGIGNIYSDEILFEARVHPLKDVSKLSERELKEIYRAMKKILKQAIKLKGESISDYRTPSGKRGGFDRLRRVYRREGEKCPRCGAIIKRIKLAGRSAYFCPKCQKR